jgi:hypothetical protein
MVDTNHVCPRHFTTKLLFARESESFPHGHAGTRIAIHLRQEQVSQP